MTRRCSHCSNNGHNARTCPARSGGGGGGADGGGVRLFGVRLTSAPAPVAMKKSASMSCIASSLGGGSGSSSPAAGGAGGGRGGGDGGAGYVSDDPAHASCSTNGRAERKKGTPWTEEEHRLFLMGLQKLGKGDWRGISRNFVVSRTPTQVASHAQKYFIRQTNSSRRKRRSSLFDMVPETPMDEDPVVAEQFTLQNTEDEATSSNQLLTVHLGQQNEAEFAKQLPTLHLRQHEESEFAEPSLPLPDLEMNPSIPFKTITDPTVPAFFPALVPVPITLWPPNVANMEEAGTPHEVLKPTPLHGKEVVKADDVVGMSKLSIGEASSGSMEPSALSLQLIGSTDTRHSAFHVNPPMTRPNARKRNNSPIHAV
ncbi:transcription factor MYBS3-like [Phragmites australis]|uniref:transcription factor MYBS3-like n=1 Tax=Phragmites australis TaxID=29695 RepID=UPI002D7922CA|nr:transcription factor MYBS3-like [Phragmites australis]